MYNKVTLIGNLGADPEVKTSSSGMAICKMRLATSQSKKVNGQYEKVTQWHSLVCFGKTAEYIGNNAKKGAKLLAEGSVSYEQYEGKDGQKRTSTSIVCDSVLMLGERGASEPRQAEASQATTDDFDIPF
jgi:single-strand DNA-binding protein